MSVSIPQKRTATIASGASESSVIDMTMLQISAILMPSAWTTANLTVLVSDSPTGTFVPLYDDEGNEVTLTAAASRMIAVNKYALPMASQTYIKLRSGTAATPVNQAADRALTIVGRT